MILRRFAVVSLTGLLSVQLMAQEDDLRQLLRNDSQLITLNWEDVEVIAALEELAEVGGFDVFMAPEVADAPPVTLQVTDTDLSSVLQLVGHMTYLNYWVADDRTLLVSFQFAPSVPPSRVHPLPYRPAPRESR